MLIALYSFGSYTELADSSDLDILFKSILSRSAKQELIMRLYKKYVRRQDVFDTISELRTQSTLYKGKQKRLLASVISACEFGAKKSELCLEKFGEYEPLRFVVLDEPYYLISHNIPLEDYDNNDGEPFWMRPEYIIEKYSKIKKS